MVVNQVLFGKEAQEKLLRGITTLAKAVKSTLGARGRTALMESQIIPGGITSTKDGVTVAKSINLADSVENMAVRVLVEAADNTARQAGDGTTTSIVLAEAMIDKAIKYIDESIHNKTEVIRNMSILIDDIVKYLDNKKISMTDEMMKNIASISANNDEFIGEIIKDAYMEVGRSGVVMVARGEDDIEVEYNGGIKFNRGIMSEFQLTNTKKRLIEMEDVYILISDRKLENLLQIPDQVLSFIVKEGKSLLIIAELGDDAQASLNENVARKRIKAANVLPPMNGYRQTELMGDLARVTGGTFLSQKTGSDWTMLTVEDLGHTERVVIDRGSTTLIDESMNDSESLISLLQELTASLDESTNTQDKEDFNNRIAMLSGKVATIKVGARTDLERKEIHDRVDDAVLAVKAAIEDGVLPGGGIALLDVAKKESIVDGSNADVAIAAKIIQESLEVPFNQILINAGRDPKKVIKDINPSKGIGYDVRMDKPCDMINSGIIDPAKVTKCALENSVAVASTILSTETVVYTLRNTDEK